MKGNSLLQCLRINQYSSNSQIIRLKVIENTSLFSADNPSIMVETKKVQLK